MAVLKSYNPLTNQWEIVTVGEKGPKGDTGNGLPPSGVNGQIVVRDDTTLAGGKWVDKVTTNVTDYGTTVDIATINTAIAAVARGIVVIPPGTYSFSGDILINTKNTSSGATGFFTLEATGVKLTGSGKIIINGSKRVKIIGLDAPNYDLYWRGCWTSMFENMRFRYLVMGDASGTGFSSAGWNHFLGGSSQKAIIHANAASWYNVISWQHHIMNGSASQGFAATADYAFEFNGNVGAQDWVFEKGDISYHTSGVYNIGAGNLTQGIELTMRDVYFDDKVPTLNSGNGNKINIDSCHHANGQGFQSKIEEALSGATVDMHRGDRAIKHNGILGLNLIQNGDFRDLLKTWIGSTDKPISAFNNGVVTAMPGGISGTYLNLSSQTNPSGICYFRSIPLPVKGRLTGTIIIRNADVGTRQIRIGITGQYANLTISDDTWTVYTTTNTDLIAVGGQENILLYAEDGSPYNVDVACASYSLGNGGDLVLPTYGHRFIYDNITWNPGTIAAGAIVQTTATVPTAIRGDFFEVTANAALSTVRASAHVDNDGFVVLTLHNLGSSSVALTSATYYLKGHKRLY